LQNDQVDVPGRLGEQKGRSLLQRNAGAAASMRSRPKVNGMNDGDRCVHAISTKRRMSSWKRLSSAAAVRATNGDALHLLFVFRPEFCISCRDAALNL